MYRSHSQINLLLIVVAVLAIGAGLAIVIATSPKSWELGPAAWLQGARPTVTAAPPTATLDLAATDAAATLAAVVASHTARPTQAPLPTRTATPNLSLTLTSEPSPTPDMTATATPFAGPWPEDVAALAEVTLADDTYNARLRDAPNGETVITVLANGTKVEVLFGEVEVDGTVWKPVRLEDGLTGWIAGYLLTITAQR